MTLDRLEKQIQFVIELDKLKRVLRQTILIDRSRQENAAEHSWQLAVMAILLHEYANEKEIDLLRVLKMALTHDLVEIDAGDTYCYDHRQREDQVEREQKAADRIFNLLPPDQGKEFRALWDEYEARNTKEARFAAALDKLQPLLHSYNTEGEMWKKNGVKSTQVLSVTQGIQEGSAVLWEYAANLINDAVKKGLLPS